MPDIDVRILGEDDWPLYREVRLAALEDAPEAFVARHEDEAALDDDVWRERMNLSHRIVAERNGTTVGVVSLGLHGDDPKLGEVFALWTAPSSRGARVARGLVEVAARRSAADGRERLYFWAGSDNAAAIGFASSFGFRPTSERRPVRVAEGADEAETDEVAMVLPLAADPTMSRNPYRD